MVKRFFSYLIAVFFLITSVVSPDSFAMDPKLSLAIGKAESELSKIEQSLQSKKRLNLKKLEQMHVRELDIKSTAMQCIEFNETAINKAADDLEVLGSQAVIEEKIVTNKRLSLNRLMLSHAQQLATCRLMLLRMQEAVSSTLLQQSALISNELFHRQDTVIQHLGHILLNPIKMIQSIKDFATRSVGLEVIQLHYKWYGLMLILITVLTVVLKKLMKAILKFIPNEEEPRFSLKLQKSILSCLRHYLPTLMFTAANSGFFAFFAYVDQKISYMLLLSVGLFAYVFIVFLLRILLYPCDTKLVLSQLPNQVAARLSERLRMLAKLLLIGAMVYFAIDFHEFPDQLTGLMRNTYLALLILNLIWATWLIGKFEGLNNTKFIRAVIILALISSLIADWLGYQNLANYILVGITGSILALLLTRFIITIWTDFINGLDEGRYIWQQRLRKKLAVKGDDYIPGSLWFRFTFGIVIWPVFFISLLKIWGLSDNSLLLLYSSINDGFELGTVEIVPSKVIMALLIFSLLLSLVGWVKRRLDKSWLNRSRMDRGSKEAMISLTGYLGVAIAFLVGLSIAGVQLANIALIAGALSVGIGFGLQNIVNNFVSGLVLLFERPIRTGDWIVVGGTEGYVRKISIRSTQIQTFDRADVIVPNSELISSQVTNWMLQDSRGRLIVPVGVAYGTDPEQVKEVLLNIAHNHEMVICNSPILSKPWVIFREFGDSALNFELRCFISEIDYRMNVLSDINFAINQAFKEAGIEIPFPQRDVHLISADREKPKE